MNAFSSNNPMKYMLIFNKETDLNNQNAFMQISAQYKQFADLKLTDPKLFIFGAQFEKPWYNVQNK